MTAIPGHREQPISGETYVLLQGTNPAPFTLTARFSRVWIPATINYIHRGDPLTWLPGRGNSL